SFPRTIQIIRARWEPCSRRFVLDTTRRASPKNGLAARRLLRLARLHERAREAQAENSERRCAGANHIVSRAPRQNWRSCHRAGTESPQTLPESPGHRGCPECALIRRFFLEHFCFPRPAEAVHAS